MPPKPLPKVKAEPQGKAGVSTPKSAPALPDLGPKWVPEEEAEINLEWGSWTEDMEASKHKDLPMMVSTENKGVERAPTARMGLALPDQATAEWKLLLVSAKGLVSVGLERRTVPIGTAYRKSENRDNVWYYTTDGILRNGARSVGKKGAIARTNDVITVRFDKHALSFWVNDRPFGDDIPDIKTGTFALSIQLHRKGDKVALVSEKFDEWTLNHIFHFTWRDTSSFKDGTKASALKVQGTAVAAVYKGSDFHMGIVPAGTGARAVKYPGRKAGTVWSEEWNVKINRLVGAIYLGIIADGHPTGVDWWCDDAVDKAWYYSGEGSLRNGNYVLAERLDIDEQPGPDVLDLSEEGETGSEAGSQDHDAEEANGVAMGGEIEEGEKAAEGANLEEEGHGESEVGGGRDEGGDVEEGHGEPWDDIPVLKEGHRVTVTLSDQTQDGLIVRFSVDGRAVPGGVPIHSKPGTKLRLAVQLEADEDEVSIMPFEGVVVRS